ncbi:MAG TPA: hypothetical protein DDZ82_05665 [Rhodobacteraceae bacterium]|jgi:hypothetical protein|nr:hypothetical protein [Paracoccaceae bacterium]HBM68296.1 hypothetical protein [Paracoccaceae bacterium]|tara:strand:- start:205 stop:474 length:270 start_codon:yes stop_codon:yes gene_type:complete
MGHFSFARANFNVAPCLRVAEGGQSRPVGFVHWQIRQSPRVIEAIKWLNFYVFACGNPPLFVEQKYFSSIRVAASSLMPPSRVLKFWSQ